MKIDHRPDRLIALVVAAGLGLAGRPARAADPADWTQPLKPFRIAGGIYYVGTKGLAAYLLVGKQGAVLLDGTSEANAALVERNIQAVGTPLRAVKVLLTNHAHDDHVGALARIKRDTGASLVASRGDAWALAHGAPRGDTEYGVRRFPPVRVDRTVRDGDTVAVGDLVLTAHLTPGHTPGCTSWSTTVWENGRRRQVLFVCSLTVAGNVLVGNRSYPDIVPDFRGSFAKLAAMKADIVLTGHPEAADVLGREIRREAGDADAFIDPTALPALVATSKAAFEHALRAAGRPLKPALTSGSPPAAERRCDHSRSSDAFPTCRAARARLR